MFASFPEIYDWIDGRDGKLFSRLFAVLVASFCIAVLAFSGFYWIKYAESSKKEDVYRESTRNRRGIFMNLIVGISEFLSFLNLIF